MKAFPALDLDKAKADFPAYPLHTLPTIPATFTDDSWRNDLCPSVYSPLAKCVVWLDWPNADDRMSGAPARYAVCRQDRDHHGSNIGEPVEIYAGDDFAKVLAVVLGEAFANTLGQWLTENAYLEMRIRNRGYADAGETGVCASHEFCDANMAMDEAFENLFGRPSVLGDDPDGEADLALFNAAWDWAKPARLTASPTEAGLPDDIRVIWARLDEGYRQNLGVAFTPAETRALHLFMNLGKAG